MFSPIREYIYAMRSEIPKSEKLRFRMMPTPQACFVTGPINTRQCALPMLVEYIYEPYKLYPNGDCVFKLSEVKVCR